MSQMLHGTRAPFPPDAIEAPRRLAMRDDRRRCSTDSDLQAVRADIRSHGSLSELIRIGFDTVKMNREIAAISLLVADHTLERCQRKACACSFKF